VFQTIIPKHPVCQSLIAICFLPGNIKKTAFKTEGYSMVSGYSGQEQWRDENAIGEKKRIQKIGVRR